MSNPIAVPDKLDAYTFDVRYAFYQLIKNRNNKNFVVCVEKIDDVSVENGNSIEIDQLKNALSENNPLSNSSIAFWKTIYNWSNILKGYSGKGYTFLFRFIVSSNCSFTKGSIIKEFEGASNESEAKTAIQKATKYFRDKEMVVLDEEHVKYCLDSENEDIVAKVIANFTIDLYANTFDEELLDSFCLQDPDTLTNNHFYWMCGRLDDYIHKKINKREIVAISIKTYNSFLDDCIVACSKATILDALSLTPSDVDINIEKERNDIYIQQMSIIDVDYDLIVDEIGNYLRTLSEINIRANDGETYEYDDYENDLKYKWKLAKILYPANNKNDEDTLKDVGRKIFVDTKVNIENVCLKNYAFPSFFNQGYVHKLANNLVVGWHPFFKDIIKKHE